MKKNSHRGFMLIETLLVSTFVLGVLTYIVIQFSALKRSYDDDFKYDTVQALYGIRNVHEYISKYNGYPSLKSSVNTYGYLDFSCGLIYGTTCTSLLKNINVEKVYLVKDSVFKGNVSLDLNILNNDEELYYFVKKINFSQGVQDYHLIVKYQDSTFATMQLSL